MTATIEERVTSLEDRMDEQERLRASQDRDLSDMAATWRVQKDLLQALATTQSEHTEKLDRLERQQEAQRNLLESLAISGLQHTETLARLDRQMRLQDGGMRKIISMLDTLIAREDGR
jgi:peptidoglycan hydrolase CwlO-like protein